MASTVWRGYISFGLISIPVRLFRAARAERIPLRRLYRKPVAESEEPASSGRGSKLSRPPRPEEQAAQLAPLRQVSMTTSADERVPETSVVKGFEYEKDRYVALESEELKGAAPPTSTALEIQEFVALQEIDPVFFETSYYVIPEEAGEKAYALLYKSMSTSQLVALAEFAMHGREHVVVLRPGKHGLLAHTMFFVNEVRADEEFHADLGEVSAKELKLAETLIHSLAAPFAPEKYRDTYREKLQAMIDRKVAGQPAPAAKSSPARASVVDISEALRKSLADLKKPAASARKSRKASGAASS